MNIEDEKYIKCSGCETSMGCFLNDNDRLFMFCGKCKTQTQFVEILKEEFEVLQYKLMEESKDANNGLQ